MALQVWLPLNGNIKNLGLSNLKFSLSGSGITTDSSGKIGSCYKRASIRSGGRIASNTTINLNGSISMFCWAKVTACVGDTANGLVSNHSHANNTGFGITVKLVSASDFRISCSTGNGSSRTYMTYYGTTNIKDKWCHLGLTYNKTSNTLKLWVNGSCEYTGTYTNSSRADYIWIFDWSTTYGDASYLPACSINDVRIYDHCLSEDEIHELTLGKIGHWKLNDAEIEPTTNILNSVTATCYNAANSKYGYSTTSNVLKTDGEFLNKQCTKIYPATNGSSWRPYTYLPTFVSNGGTDPKYKTLQFDYYSTTSTYLNPYKLGDGNSTAHWKCINSTGVHTGSGTNNVYITVNPNEWNHVEIIFEGTSSASAQWGYFINGNAVTSSSNTYHLYANVMVEEKNHSTPYTKTSRVRGNVPDISGNHHDLTVNGNPTLSDDSVRYDKSCLFGSGISLTPLVPSFLTNEATVSMWVKLDQLPPSSPGRTMLYTTWYGFSCEVTSAGKTYFRTQLTSGTVDSPQGTIAAGNWTHWVGVKSSTGVSLYLNGTLVGTASNSNNFNWSSSASNAIGAYGGSYYTYGKLSDVRLYATALSADDVLKLYKLGNV